MGVVRVNFGSGPERGEIPEKQIEDEELAEKRQTQPRPLEQPSLQQSNTNGSNALEKLQELGFIALHRNNLLKIKKLRASPAALGNMRRLVSSYTVKEAMDYIERSSESDWTTKPAFYRALVEKIQKKI